MAGQLTVNLLFHQLNVAVRSNEWQHRESRHSLAATLIAQHSLDLKSRTTVALYDPALDDLYSSPRY
jgi:hypothetical protein